MSLDQSLHGGELLLRQTVISGYRNLGIEPDLCLASWMTYVNMNSFLFT